MLLPHTDSTNTYLSEWLRAQPDLEDMTVVVTYDQRAGRGQTGNQWETGSGKNIALSLLLRPQIDVREQFGISMIAALSVADTMRHYGIEPQIKWPNDVYIGTKKTCGILIENGLSGHNIETCIVGIGVNVNQTKFENLPFATSMAIESQKTFDLEEVTRTLTNHLTRRYIGLLNDGAIEVKAEYLSLLVNGDGKHAFVDIKSGKRFVGTIADVEMNGRLVIELDNGESARYYFKELRQVIDDSERE